MSHYGGWTGASPVQPARTWALLRPILHIQQDLSRVTDITISGDDCHRCAFASLLLLRRGWGNKPLVQVGGTIHYDGIGKRQRASFQSKSSQQKQAAIDFMGINERVQSALHPLPRYRDGAERSLRSLYRGGSRHHRSDCRGLHSYSRVERRRTALPFGYLSAR